MLAAILAVGGSLPATHTGDGSAGMQIELWQVINLIGAPLLAMLFARPVIDDVKAWLASDRRSGDS